MTLAEAIRSHLSCDHSLALSRDAAVLTVTHDGGSERFTVTPVGTDTERGSALFHAIANELIGYAGHADTDLAISDDEFAAFAEAK